MALKSPGELWAREGLTNRVPIPEDTYPPLHLSPQRQRQKTLESIVAILLELAEQQPVLFILEDLHWTDPTTLELLGLLVEQVPTAAIYTLLTCRPHFQPSWHHRSYLTEVTVSRLSRHQIERVAEHVAGGKKLPPEVLHQIVGKTDGVGMYSRFENSNLMSAIRHFFKQIFHPRHRRFISTSPIVTPGLRRA